MGQGQRSPQGLVQLMMGKSFNELPTVCQVTGVISQWGDKPKELLAVKSSAALNK